MKSMEGITEAQARQLVLDELFDLTLYKNFHKITHGSLKKVFGDLIPVETRHFAFWQEFFDIKVERLDLPRRLKMAILVVASRLFGETGIHLILEAIEVYGVRKYLNIWKTYRGKPVGEAVREILRDEFGHEDTIVSRVSARHINPEKIRSIFLGLNDGLVEILGAVSGFFAAFQNASSVIIAWLTVTVAGSISMAAGAYAGTSSEAEVRNTEDGKREFLGEAVQHEGKESPLSAAAYVGISYFFGSLIPILPVLFGAKSIILSVVLSIAMIVVVSVI
ncbi:MAG: VIT1/CCC1 transporter family protein, partial [Acidobacteriia bacterium]|nr:VIT1/CCC1 transporter family protein [Terriglobia bacterium]